MICQNCNTENSNEHKFCIRCGTGLINNNPVQPVMNESVQPTINNVSTQSQVVQNSPVVQETTTSVQMSQNMSATTIVNNTALNYAMYIIAILLKPFKCFKEEESKLSDVKTSIILSSIVAGTMTIVDFIKAMISAIFVKTLDYSTFQYKTTVEFSNLKNLDYIELIFKNLLIYAGVIVAIALVYYLVAFIFKKSLNFVKLLAISATSVIPYVILVMIISPIAAKIWMPLSIVSVIIGVVYTFLILLNLMSNELKFENIDLKIYFHLICLSILGSGLCYVVYKLIFGSLSSSLGSYLNLLG